MDGVEVMADQERQIINLLLNEMAFEGAKCHYNEILPHIDINLDDELQNIGGAPKVYSKARRRYEDKEVNNWYEFLRIIRNNVIHANKAVNQNEPARLSSLLELSDRVIEAVNRTDSPFAKRANEIKSALQISF